MRATELRLERALLFLVLGMFARSSDAAIISLRPVDDGYKYTTSSVTRYINIGVGSLDGDDLTAGLEFEISSIPLNAVINSATLSLQKGFDHYATGPSSTINFSIHGFAGDGILTDADFAGTNPIAGPFVSSYVLSRNPSYQLADLTAVDVTSFAQSLLASSESHALFTLALNSRTGPLIQSFIGSRHELDPTMGPRLVIDYSVQAAAVPEPSSMVLIGLGGLGLIAARKRRQAA